MEYLGRPAEFDKYKHLDRDVDTFQCGLIKTQTNNDQSKPLCSDCVRRSREVWRGPGIGYVVE